MVVRCAPRAVAQGPGHGSRERAPPHAPVVLVSCAPRPGDVAGENRARPSFSGGVGDADAALKRWHCGREDRGADLCAPRFAAVLEHLAPCALAPARPEAARERLRKEASRPSSPYVFCIEGLAGRQRLPWRPLGLTISATSSPTLSLSSQLLTEEMPLHLLIAETGPQGRALSRASEARREAAEGPGQGPLRRPPGAPCAPVLGRPGPALRASRFARP